MPFRTLIIKVSSDTGDVLRPGYDTYVGSAVCCRSTEQETYAAAVRRLDRERELRKAARGRRPSEAFRLKLVKMKPISFATWLWGCFGSGITLFNRAGPTTFEEIVRG